MSLSPTHLLLIDNLRHHFRLLGLLIRLLMRTTSAVLVHLLRVRLLMVVLWLLLRLNVLHVRLSLVVHSGTSIVSPVRTVVTTATSAPANASRTPAHHVSLRLMVCLMLQLRMTWLLLLLLRLLLHHLMTSVDHLRARWHATGYLMLLLWHLNERLLSTCSGSNGRGSRRYKRM